MYGIPLSLTTMVVTGYMLCGAMGMVIGGFWWRRVERLEDHQRSLPAGLGSRPGVTLVARPSAHAAGMLADLALFGRAGLSCWA